MKTLTYLEEIQKRLPDDVLIQNETTFEFNEDEYIGILSWIKNFNKHYEIFGKSEHPYVKFPIISKRLRLDFGLYNFPSDLEDKNKGKYIIYISSNLGLLTFKNEPPQTIKELIRTGNFKVT